MQIFKYVEFLLPKHNCVIIPDFGGFVLSIEAARFDTDRQLIAPTCSLVFNQALKYNDGLLANAISETENVGYDVACTKIKESVKDIKAALSQSSVFKCGNLGTFRVTDDENIAFAADDKITYPSFYGLTPVGLQPLHMLDIEYNEPSKRPLVKYIICAAAAAAIAALLYVSPISLDLFKGNMQQAGFIESFGSATSASVKAIQHGSIKPFLADSIAIVNDSTQNTNLTQDSVKTVVETTNTELPKRTYYIVIGGEDSEEQANRYLAKIKQARFSQANVVEGTDRYRIYVASFSNKKEAERFLDIFRIENPEYATAWLYSKRNS